MARTVAAGSGSSFWVSVWCTISLLIGANEGGVLLRIDSSAPHCDRVITGGSGTFLAAGCGGAVVEVVVGSNGSADAARPWGDTVTLWVAWVVSMATSWRSATEPWT